MFPAADGEGSGAPPASWQRAGRRPGRPIDAARFVWALRRRWRLIALAVALGIPAGALIARLLVPRRYTSRAVLVWEPARARALVDPEREIKTLVDTIKLPDNLAEVRRRTAQPLTLEALARRIDVDMARDSNLLTISGEATDAEGARQLTGAMTRVFLDGCLRVERARAEERLRALDEEVARVQAQLAEARERYDQFRSRNGISDLALDRQAAIEEAALLRTEAYRNRIQVESEDAKAALLRSAASHEPAKVVLSETQTHADERKLAELRAELTARRASLSGEHPEVQGLAAAVEALEKAPPADAGVAERSVGTNPNWIFLQHGLLDASAEREAAQQKSRAYSKLETSTRDRIAQLSAVEGQASLMLAGIRIAENRLGDLQAQQKVAEGDVRQPVAPFRVLTEASLPSLPSRSHRRLVALGLPLLLGVLATAACAGQALRGLKPWTPSEIAFWGRGPVVATSTWPAGAEGLEDLVLDLGPSLEQTRGVTLVLALAPARAPHAAELSSRLEQRLAVSRREGVSDGDGSLSIWNGPVGTRALRRAARRSSRVLVLLEAGAHSVFELAAVHPLLGREDRIGFVVLGLGIELAGVPDRVGDVAGFWRGPGAPPGSVGAPPQPMEYRS